MQSGYCKNMRDAAISEILQDIFIHKACVSRQHSICQCRSRIIHARKYNLADMLPD